MGKKIEICFEEDVIEYNTNVYFMAVDPTPELALEVANWHNKTIDHLTDDDFIKYFQKQGPHHWDLDAVDTHYHDQDRQQVKAMFWHERVPVGDKAEVVKEFMDVATGRKAQAERIERDGITCTAFETKENADG